MDITYLIVMLWHLLLFMTITTMVTRLTTATTPPTEPKIISPVFAPSIFFVHIKLQFLEQFLSTVQDKDTTLLCVALFSIFRPLVLLF